ncbi:MAG: tRNA pseudouridine(55) synthase TruB [Gammaproteobacteria bacterium]|nr:tRNA pseudouridine(55) synthase TruB [Gammaproteobacteria bacterium]
MSDYKQSCIILDKPSGISSNQALSKVKKKISQKKAGFSGTLDPLASGLLIIFFNKATKLCSYFLNADKSYEAIAILGKTSTTGDLDGDILSSNNIPDLKKLDISMLEKKYTGIIKQTPPMYSAIKHKGVRLYKYAREGINIDLPPREIEIFSIKINIIDNSQLFIKVRCSKGTYIRTLVEQIGIDIGCGALVSKLVRTGINDINISKSVGLENFLSSSDEEICKKYIINGDLLLSKTSTCFVSDLNKEQILKGNKVKIKSEPCELIRIYDKDKNFLGIGKINEELELLPKKILV